MVKFSVKLIICLLNEPFHPSKSRLGHPVYRITFIFFFLLATRTGVHSSIAATCDLSLVDDSPPQQYGDNKKKKQIRHYHPRRIWCTPRYTYTY